MVAGHNSLEEDGLEVHGCELGRGVEHVLEIPSEHRAHAEPQCCEPREGGGGQQCEVPALGEFKHAERLRRWQQEEVLRPRRPPDLDLRLAEHHPLAGGGVDGGDPELLHAPR